MIFLEKLVCAIPLCLLTLGIILPHSATAWTLRGHQIVCEAAIFFIQDAELKEFLQGKGLVMSHLCNLPDTQWRDIEPDRALLGNASHYFAADLVNLKVGQIDKDYPRMIWKFLSSHPEASSEMETYKKIGSNWWRAEQFYKRAISLKGGIHEVALPHTPKESQDPNFPYNQKIFDFMINLGIMGHFVGDNSQPFHVTHNYDGYENGHGGIHLFYEDEAVNALPEDLFSRVLREGHHHLSKSNTYKWMKTGSIVERMRKLGEISLSERDRILKWDPVIEPSQVRLEGTERIQIPAKRKQPKQVALGARDLIVKEMARGAALLAQFWQEAYREIGRPSLKSYKSYQFPTHIDFVAPDYIGTPDKN